MNFKEILKEAIKNNTKIIITGKSGYGKSEMVAQVAKELNYELIDFRLSEILPEDLVGVPKVRDDYYEYVPPKWLYDVIQNPNKKYLLFLDEITQGTPEVLNICYKIFDKITKVGNHTLDNVAVVGATNYSDESNYLNELPDPLKKRACMLELDHTPTIYSNYLMSKYDAYLKDYNKTEKAIIENFIIDTIKESNPRSTDKAIELIHNNCSVELVSPFIGYTNYSNLVNYFSSKEDSQKQATDLSNLEKAQRDLQNGYCLIGSKRYDIEEPADLLVLYNLTPEEYEIINQAYTTEFKGNKQGNKKETIYAALNSMNPTIDSTKLENAANKSCTFNWTTYAKKIKLMAKDKESVTNQINVLQLIKDKTSLEIKEIFDLQGSMIQYCAPDLLAYYSDSINWTLYADLYKKGRISEKNATALMSYFKQYI